MRSWAVGSWNEGPSRDWAWWRLDGWGASRPRRRDGEWGDRLPSPPCFVWNLLIQVCLSRVSTRKVDSEHLFCVLMYMNPYIFHFISFEVFSGKTHLKILMYVWRHHWLTHGIAKYGRKKEKKEEKRGGGEKKRKRKGNGFTGVEERGYWGG